MNRVDVLIQPFCLRFSLQEYEIVYHVAGHADMQLDRMELLMGVDPQRQTLFDANCGFLPVATAVLIRGERTIVVDPGNHHVGFYGSLGLALKRFGLTPDDVDMVICTHSHHDHMASAGMFGNAELVIGAGELDFARLVYGAAETDARLARHTAVREVSAEAVTEVAAGVQCVPTPGHTPGHISVIVDDGSGRSLIAGDLVMTRGEWYDATFSHWYSAEQRAQLQAGVDRVRGMGVTRVFPGHDRAFEVRP
jgi:glyoxylase-like metal-dependent hydrolase (beta-lactamase superfamily II)